MLREIKQGHMFIEWTQRDVTHRWYSDLFMPLKLRALGQMIILRVGEVGEVRESVSESNRGGLVTILFVLRAWDWSLVFDAMRASMGPQYSTSHRLFFVCLCTTSSLIPFNQDFNLCEHFCCSFVTHMIPRDMYEKTRCGWYWLTCRGLNNNLLAEYFKKVFF